VDSQRETDSERKRKVRLGVYYTVYRLDISEFGTQQKGIGLHALIVFKQVREIGENDPPNMNIYVDA